MSAFHRPYFNIDFQKSSVSKPCPLSATHLPSPCLASVSDSALHVLLSSSFISLPLFFFSPLPHLFCLLSILHFMSDALSDTSGMKRWIQGHMWQSRDCGIFQTMQVLKRWENSINRITTRMIYYKRERICRCFTPVLGIEKAASVFHFQHPRPKNWHLMLMFCETSFLVSVPPKQTLKQEFKLR